MPSTIQSVRTALARRGARRVGVITPYVEALNEKIRESIEADGIEVAAIDGLGITENFAIARVEPGEIVAFARRTLGGQTIDVVFASCTNLRAVDAIAALEEAMGVPAVTSNQAVLEAVLGRFGMSWPADASGGAGDAVRMGAGGVGA